ncbi:MAG TPA: replication initiator, partial [Acidimicrobiales bacterium]|nr:replication initiator [Acidimicrobiales bacterium]
MSDPDARWALVREVGGAGCCAHPVRLAGQRVDGATGEIGATTIAVACKDRRMAVCPSCSTLYRRDAWHLVAAGLRGGKGVPEAVGAHPLLFVTLTAPGFGAVHSRSGEPGQPGSLCHPRRSGVSCTHGVALGCFERHSWDDRRLGSPLCAACFDYRGAVLWNAHASRLFQRTRERIVREVAHSGSVPVREVGDVFRLSYVKVVEFQRRGLAH